EEFWPDQVAHDHVDAVAAGGWEVGVRSEIAAKEFGERRPVRNVEKAQGADLAVDFKRIETGPEYAFLQSLLIECADACDCRLVDVAQAGRAIEIGACMDVLDHHHANEILMGVMM